MSSKVLQVEGSEWEKLIQNLIREGILRSPKIIEAIRSVPRGKFLPENMVSYSAVDTPLPIGFGQTASAPHSFGLSPKLGETWFQ
jgi:protein-L-isoaspartate(D-aspartate) O-methyltransferase